MTSLQTGHFDAHPAEEHLMAFASAAAPGAGEVVKQARAAGLGWQTIFQYLFSANGLQLLMNLIAALLAKPPVPAV